ncbi:hypothetical protein ANCDUO_14975 [Ancylostoma duodenale]|uniref:Uncharacterized protein n=1 Tax=Ancylostoma duodenale TaxID=51022 RepID=A0A0C2G1R7_9BILA|nr:hypothetical protein ANCDUO_14975 [Ancylostoma duodenale]
MAPCESPEGTPPPASGLISTGACPFFSVPATILLFIVSACCPRVRVVHGWRGGGRRPSPTVRSRRRRRHRRQVVSISKKLNSLAMPTLNSVTRLSE